MLIVDGMPELSLLHSFLTSFSMSLFFLSFLVTILSEHTTTACDTMSVSLLMAVCHYSCHFLAGFESVFWHFSIQEINRV